MISIAYQGVAIPIIWSMLPKRGNSNTLEHKAIIHRFIDLFSDDCIDSFLADREFIGDEWFREVIKNRISFYIRIRENLWVDVLGKGPTKASWLFNDLALNTARHYRKIVCIDCQWVYLSGMKVVNRENKIEFVIVASYRFDPLALAKYKDRW